MDDFQKKSFQHLNKFNVNVECPYCPKNEVEIHRVAIALHEPMNPITSGIDTAALRCKNCGYMRFFNIPD